MNIYKLVLIFCIVFTSVLTAQDYTLDEAKSKYPFINFDANEIKFAENSPSFKKLYYKLNAVANGEDEKVHIFHIGGSHIQADIYSNRLRAFLQNMNSTSRGQRGFIYPFKLASTNNPSNYNVTFDGEWKGYRCSIKKDSVAWGLSGVSAVFKDSISNLSVKANHRGYDTQKYDFNRIRVFYDNWSYDFEINLKDSSLLKDISVNKEAHFIEFGLTETVEELDFCIERVIESEDSEFLMMGLELMNENSGIQYTSIGVNGASFSSYNRSRYFNEQLSLYQPDLFIVSIGTNDAYHPEFDEEAYEMYYEKLILDLQKINPDCAILLTVPNDSYYKKKEPNPRTQIMQDIIYRLAQKHNMAVWDFYEIMGGFNSSMKWYKNKLMPSDRIHFKVLGYRIKADLLLQALANSWEDNLELGPNSILKDIINE